MIVADLIKELQKYPQDLGIWVSDDNMGEGALPLLKVRKVLAVEAGLDGDEVDDEYDYPEEFDKLEPESVEFTQLIMHWNEKGYRYIAYPGEHAVSKYILLLETS
jgi:hypothetical protein